MTDFDTVREAILGVDPSLPLALYEEKALAALVRIEAELGVVRETWRRSVEYGYAMEAERDRLRANLAEALSPAPVLRCDPEAAEPLDTANGPSGAFPVGNDGEAGAGVCPVCGYSFALRKNGAVICRAREALAIESIVVREMVRLIDSGRTDVAVLTALAYLGESSARKAQG